MAQSLTHLAGAAVLLVGCGPIGNAVKTIKGDGRKTTQADFSAADANGTWKVTCQPASFVQNNAYISTTLVIEGSILTRDATYWSDAACKIQLLSRHQIASLAIGEAVDDFHRTVEVTSLTTIDTAATSQMASALNIADGTCGHKDWVAGQPIDVTVTTCSSLSASAQLTINVIAVSRGSSPETLSLMQAKNGTETMGPGDQYTLAQ